MCLGYGNLFNFPKKISYKPSFLGINAYKRPTDPRIVVFVTLFKKPKEKPRLLTQWKYDCLFIHSSGFFFCRCGFSFRFCSRNPLRRSVTCRASFFLVYKQKFTFFFLLQPTILSALFSGKIILEIHRENYNRKFSREFSATLYYSVDRYDFFRISFTSACVGRCLNDISFFIYSKCYFFKTSRLTRYTVEIAKQIKINSL